MPINNKYVTNDDIICEKLKQDHVLQYRLLDNLGHFMEKCQQYPKQHYSLIDNTLWTNKAIQTFIQTNVRYVNEWLKLWPVSENLTSYIGMGLQDEVLMKQIVRYTMNASNAMVYKNTLIKTNDEHVTNDIEKLFEHKMDYHNGFIRDYNRIAIRVEQQIIKLGTTYHINHK